MPACTAQTQVLHETHDAASNAPSLHALGNGRCIESEDRLLFIPIHRLSMPTRMITLSPPHDKRT